MPSAFWIKPTLYSTLNIASATGIVFANKAVLSVYGFEFATALTLLHTLTTVLGMLLFCQLGVFVPKQIPTLQVRQPFLLTFMLHFCFSLHTTETLLSYVSIPASCGLWLCLTGDSIGSIVCWLCCPEQPEPEAEHRGILSNFQNLYLANAYCH